MILVAGKGTRLRPLTKYVPKSCLPIAGIPLIWIWLEKLYRAGIKEVFLNPSYGASYVQELIYRCPCKPKSITIRTEREPYGTAATIKRASDWIANKPFLIIYGDVLTNLDLRHFRKSRKGFIFVATYKTQHPEQKGIFTVGKDGHVENFVEKPENPNGDDAFAGIALAQPGFVDVIGELEGSRMLKVTDLTADVFPSIAKRIRIYQPEVPPYYRDIGTIQDYLGCQMEWRELWHSQDTQGE